VARSTKAAEGSAPPKGFVASQSAKRTVIELGALLLGLVVIFFVGRWAVGCSAEAIAMNAPLRIDEEIGRVAAEQMRAKYNFSAVPSETQIQRVSRVFDELRSVLNEEETRILRNPRVTVLVDEQVNAFALPGGEVFVLTGFLNRVGADGDDMLRGVLAHELGHAVKRHGVRGLARRAAFSMVMVSLIGDVDEMILLLASGASQLDGLAHSREMESEADAFGADLLTRAGHDTEGLATFLESLETQPVPELLSTHPDPLERARLLRAR
jgi:predicted Zn-dependent protease